MMQEMSSDEVASPPKLRRAGLSPQARRPMRKALVGWLFLIAVCTVCSTWLFVQDIYEKATSGPPPPNRPGRNLRKKSSDPKDGVVAKQDLSSKIEEDLFKNNSTTAVVRKLQANQDQHLQLSSVGP